MRPGAVIAPARRPAALLPDYWRQATEIRREWLAVGLSTEPADRSTAEQAITEIYARHRRGRPRFHWVASPRAALPYLAGLPTHETLRSWTAARRPPGVPPAASDIAAGLSRLRNSLADGYLEPPREGPPIKHRTGERWPVLPPDEALAAGLPFVEVLRQGIRDALFRSLAHGVYLPIRAALGPVPVCWYGHQDAAWIGHYDVLRRIGLARYDDAGWFATWVTLARSAGWWWPGEDRCVLVERPVVIRTEPVPGTWHGEVRLRRVEYRDGWSC